MSSNQLQPWRSVKTPIMAKIILEPLEEFEHNHQEDSFTILLSGEATFALTGQEIHMELNKRYLTPAGQVHIMRNTGKEDCVLGCGLHKPPKPKE